MRQHRVTAGVAVYAIMLGLAGPASAADPSELIDIAGTTHEQGISAVVEADIATGFGDGTFRPARAVTRGQLATLLTAALDLPAGNPSGFSDVAGTTHEDSIGALVEAGLAAGYPDGTFRPDEGVSRGQLATMLAGGFDLAADDTTRFRDVPGTTHEPGIGAVAAAGIAGGVQQATFAPLRKVTRGQMATFVARGLELVERIEPPAPVSVPDLDVPVTLTEVASMDSPTAGTVAPDGTIYLAERAGTVHPLTGAGVGDPVIDVSAETTSSGEGGLLGIAFSDDGTELYLSYTDTDGDTALDGVAVVDGMIQPGQRRSIYTVEQPQSNHNGGHVTTGPSGLLYLGLGDGGGSGDPEGNGQDLSTPLGSLVRIDPQGGDPYAVPDDNPFVDVEGAAPEIYAYGLRNPWRFSFDAATGDLWIADVGQGTREEINRVTPDEAAGANFGWNLMEGTQPFAGSEPDDHVPPVYGYATHGPQGCAVTGGYVYRGEAIPQLRGAYLYADFCNGEVRALDVGPDGAVIDQASLGIHAGQAVSFVEDADGELYVLDLGGTVSRIDPA